jgi:phosphoribosylformimino-5-aminoimidazole carboxamide ribonucleotide (ProFAR) isomerase
VAEERLRHVQGDAAEEDAHEEEPFEVFEDWEAAGVS